MNIPVFHGITLAKNGYIKNTRVEICTNDPVGDLLPGRIWYNDTENLWKYTYIDDSSGLLEIGNFDSIDKSGGSSEMGWKDLIMPMSSALIPPSKSPIFAYLSNGLGYYHFPDNKDKHLMLYFHIPHDYKPGSLIYPHVHWAGLSPSIGTVHWQLEFNIAKGHEQGGLFTSNTQIIDLIQSGSSIIGEHIVTECTDVEAFIVPEPDTIVTMKVSRLGSKNTDTFIGETIGVFCDLHYQSDRETTPNKKPDFYN